MAVVNDGARMKNICSQKRDRHRWRGGLLIVWMSLVMCRAVAAAPAPAPVLEDGLDWLPAAETIVIYNRRFDGSETLARYYAAKREIPADHLLGFDLSRDETITREEFESTIREPLIKKFNEKEWWRMETRDVADPNGKPRGQAMEVVQQDVRVIVLMRGVPLRVKRSVEKNDLPLAEADEASVDSEIAALGVLGRPVKGPLENRYFQSTRRFPDHYDARGQMLVGRLDAADDATVRRMIDDSLRAEREGLWGRAGVDFALLDEEFLEGERWLGNSVKRYREAGIPVFVDRSKEIIRERWPLPDTILYFGWYTLRCSGALASSDFRFKPGAIACHLHSFSATALRTKTDNWCGPLLDHGAAAVLGNVWDPFVITTATHFDLLNARLLDGFTLGEAAWSATPAVSWMNVLVGDPLYMPFGRKRATVSKNTADQDYTAYRDLTDRLLWHDRKKFFRELLKLADERKSGRLLEMAGLFSTIEEMHGLAEEFYQHARAVYRDPADQLRCALYAAELSQRQGNYSRARDKFAEIIADPKFKGLPALNAAESFAKGPAVGAAK